MVYDTSGRWDGPLVVCVHAQELQSPRLCGPPTEYALLTQPLRYEYPGLTGSRIATTHPGADPNSAGTGPGPRTKTGDR